MANEPQSLFNLCAWAIWNPRDPWLRSGPARPACAREEASRARSQTKILAVADEVDESLYGDALPALVPDLVLACGDLPFDYLEYLVTRLNVPLLYVPGNHDPELRPIDTTWTPPPGFIEPPTAGPEGCMNVDGRLVEESGLRVAGLGGSIRYKPGPNQYSQRQMSWRATKLAARIRFQPASGGRKLDVLITHSPPAAAGEGQDPAHAGFVAFDRLIRRFHPLLAVHGHVHPYGRVLPERQIGTTRVVNVVAARLLEI